MQHGPATELGRQLRPVEVALEHLEPGAVVEHTLLPLLGLLIKAHGGVHDDQFGREPPRLRQKLLALARLEVAVEMAREHAGEGAVVERQVKRIATDDGCLR